MYIDLVTLEGQEFHVTACPSGFYLNKSSGPQDFSPEPRKSAQTFRHLVGLLQQVGGISALGNTLLQNCPSSPPPMLSSSPPHSLYHHPLPSLIAPSLPPLLPPPSLSFCPLPPSLLTLIKSDKSTVQKELHSAAEVWVSGVLSCLILFKALFCLVGKSDIPLRCYQYPTLVQTTVPPSAYTLALPPLPLPPLPQWYHGSHHAWSTGLLP